MRRAFPDDSARLHFIEDNMLHVALWKAGSRLPARIDRSTFGTALSLLTAWELRQRVIDLVKTLKIQVVHQPTPVSPKAPSMLFNVGAPVIIGPLNGGMTFPPNMNWLERRSERLLVGGLRLTANLANRLIPGKRHAARILVANSRTRNALPRLPKSVEITEVVENGVDLTRWQIQARERHPGSFRIAFVGRLVDWKGVDLLLEAIRRVAGLADVHVGIFGDGPERARLEEKAKQLNLGSSITFYGFVPQTRVAESLGAFDALVLPSLYECGGAVVLEAMSLGMPVIASNWGGPADYLDSTCGILIPVSGCEPFTVALADAILQLAQSPERCRTMGLAARNKVAALFDWERKVDTMLGIYSEAIGVDSAR
jgi:glycosyltransferase involved in cell wall biosynthesis